MVRNIMMIGSVGSGKGTQCTLLSNEFGYKIIGVGDILREEQHKDTERGRYTKGMIGTGNLFPDDFINELMVDVLSEYISNDIPFILEGYPRSKKQAEFMDSMIKIDKVIYLNVTHEEKLVERLIERGKTSGRKDDSSVEIIKLRLDQYRTITYPVVEHYRASGSMYEIDADNTVEIIYEKIKEIL